LGIYSYHFRVNATGTVEIINVDKTPDDSSVEELTVVGDKLFFAAYDPVYSWDLWITEETSLSTVPVREHDESYRYCVPEKLTAVGDLLFYTCYDIFAGRELWRSDGTEAGTFLVKDINLGITPSDYSYFTIFNNNLYFFCRRRCAWI